jgi:hypothetical protein
LQHKKQKYMETSIIPEQGSDKPSRKGNIVLKNLTKEQKQKLMSGQIGLAGIAMGAGAFALMGFVGKSDGETSEEAGNGEAAIISTEAPFAEKHADNMTFEQAFDAARQEVGQGGFFEYNGNLYNTYTQEEWQNMTPSEQQQYWTSIDQNTTTITDVEPHLADDITIDTPIDPVIEETIENEVNQTDDNILEVDYLAELDANEDGYGDILIVDADGNEIPDLILDDNFDGTADRIVMNVDIDAGITGNEQQYSLEGVEVKINDQETVDDINTDAPVLTVNYIDELDADGDGNNDVMIVDANGNETPELLIDNDGDGKVDSIMFDVNTTTGITGNEEEYELEGIDLNIVRPQDTEDTNKVTANDLKADYLSEAELNPGGNTHIVNNDAPNFDNEYDVSDYS